MRTVRERAYAKLNLSLDVTGRRADGYHDMEMVMQTASLWDDVEICMTEGGFSSSANLRYIPNDERNLAVKAAKIFYEAAGISGGARINLNKHIPVGAGMGGGSTDAAAVLRGLNRLTGRTFSAARLEELGAKVGSDVPFCICGGTQLAHGRGEILTPLAPLPDCGIIICKPDFGVSTPELFKKLDQIQLKCHPDTRGIIAALADKNLPEIARRMYNVFEDVPDRRRRGIAALRRELLDSGAMGAIMTGSGSAVFGLYKSYGEARRAWEKVRRGKTNCFVCKNISRLKV